MQRKYALLSAGVTVLIAALIGVELSLRIAAGPSRFAGNAITEINAPVAPNFAAGTWINSEPLKIEDLRGRVVAVHFWTFGCYNCRNTLPYVKRWNERYRDKGLTIVGVHSPELDPEKELDNVRREVGELGITYPVVTDNDYNTWRAYKVEAWPTIFVVDRFGKIRWTHVGEGAYDETERVIQQLLAETSGAVPSTALEIRQEAIATRAEIRSIPSDVAGGRKPLKRLTTSDRAADHQAEAWGE